MPLFFLNEYFDTFVGRGKAPHLSGRESRAIRELSRNCDVGWGSLFPHVGQQQPLDRWVREGVARRTSQETGLDQRQCFRAKSQLSSSSVFAVAAHMQAFVAQSANQVRKEGPLNSFFV